MNICLTANRSPWSKYAGGGQVVAHNLAKQWAEMGHKVFMVYPAREKGEYPDNLAYQIIEVKDFGRYDRSLNIFPVLEAVRSIISQAAIDIMVGSTDEAALLHFLSKKSRQPIFTMIAHHPYQIPFKVRWDFSKPVRLFKERVLYLQKYAFDHAAMIFSVSSFTKNWLTTTMGILPDKIEVVYNGVALEFIDISRRETCSNEIILTTWGRLESQKGIDILIKSLPLVLRGLTDNDIKLTVNIAGQAPPRFMQPSYTEEYQQLANSLGVADKVNFLGRVSDSELRELLSRTTLCIHPSRVEGFGLMVAESMAAGVPTISTNTSSIPEIITDGENGYLVPPEDPEALAEKILFALNHPEDIKRAGQAGRERIKQNFTWEKVAARYCATYESLLKSKRC